jgi:phosphoribosylaminoimidazole-succinocarboxamide synthase
MPSMNVSQHTEYCRQITIVYFHQKFAVMIKAIEQTISSTDFHFPGQTGIYKGKVRDVYMINNELMVMVVSDRISAFDVILPRTIPFKGQVLNQLAVHFLAETASLVPNWVLASPDPNVTIGRKCNPYKVEMVIRGYLAGHAWRNYSSGERILCGVKLPDGLKENDRLPVPIITPTTKSDHGHDEDISRDDIIKKKIVDGAAYEQLEEYTQLLFKKGSEMAADKGLILVDTKYEFGEDDGKIYLIDEIHTPDSSRYFYAEGYEQRQNKNEPQKQLSKEFLRQWLIEKGFQGLHGQQVPKMDDEIVQMVSDRYIELFEKITGRKFERVITDDILGRVESNVVNYLKEF